MILGTLAGIAASMSVGKALTFVNSLYKTTKAFDKYIIPIGTGIVAGMVGDAADKYTERKIAETKEMMTGVKELTNDIIEKKRAEMEAQNVSEPVVTNVFDKANEEVDEDGEN